jgi:hypothetical protein
MAVYSQDVFCRKEVSEASNLRWPNSSDDPETHGCSSRTSHTDKNCVVVKGMIE